MSDSDAALRAVALDAALAELQQWGVDRFSIEGVAQRSELDADLIRRSWHRPQDLIVDALLSSTSVTIGTPDTGSLADDLGALAESVSAYLNDPVGRRIARMLVIDSKSHTVDDEARLLLWRRHLQMMETIVERATQRGEFRPEVRPITVLQLLVSPLQTCALYTSARVEHDYCRAVADLVTRAVSTAS
ncbi:TetR-like C-terminal domain-containing protein [Mycobacterium sp. PSTR-4-N]|uniref:TetR-like C-terminal domain-containing protein n=1 Tax=Mycobacterium sp. PSTR-4-N TaxID=2917745 RepID=UPI001F14A94C|nr:TetR-like C-terminal domain-containing protein [Mycobacterium sp. PSTR-4-N]MCG7592913.1 TetR/AcrR family transcriptional regulator C-terminal ligand-binding domain-containing protein [Mycobacterium sp. PSTR-4-N]